MKVLEALEKLGLTEYESRAYMKLVEYGHLSAKEASKLTEIPYSKIYTTLISLVDKGWVSIKEGRPKKYRPIEPSFATELALKNQTQALIDASKTISDTLQSLYGEDTAAGKSEIWSIRGHANVLRKVGEIISSSCHEIFCLLVNPDDGDLIQISAMIQEAKKSGCKVLAFYKKSPEKKVDPSVNNLIIWESSHQITGKGIFMFADSKVIFIGSIDEKPVALWSNDLSLAEVIRNIVSVEKLGKYSSCLSASAP